MLEHEKILNSVRERINNFSICNIKGCTNESKGLTILEQDSEYHLRFIPQCLDVDFDNNRTTKDPKYSLILKKGTLLPSEKKEKGKTPIKRETYLEFSRKKNSPLELVLVTFSLEIVEKVKKLGLNVEKANNNCFHIEHQKIFSLKSEFDVKVTNLLNILDKLYI